MTLIIKLCRLQLCGTAVLCTLETCCGIPNVTFEESTNTSSRASAVNVPGDMGLVLLFLSPFVPFFLQTCSYSLVDAGYLLERCRSLYPHHVVKPGQLPFKWQLISCKKGYGHSNLT
ncbi:hypothetical protein C8Q69DRAFT_53024 [Paecilomyces variotii]|uniref:Secreted protein n=1 Tax=Byssochlamys spectabilis TaxID=264951 RepID=A0A443I849_BYSSP|nr:hypothetical protein C8Q69DRAFT_53024 [Paecilomyces variotii]RWR00260.1 hypothetical protein C8Q69DRAFT_53024 [Paecilomyces variotii]